MSKNWIADNWAQIITVGIALYGAVMSTITFVANKKEKTRQLEADITNGFLTYDHGLSGGMLFLTVRNKGYKTASINAPFLLLPNKSKIVFTRPQSNVTFPYKLEEGTDCQIWIEIGDIAEMLYERGYRGEVKLQCGVNENGGKTIYSKKLYKLNIDVWLKRA
ncbi:hypothetical protein M3194_15655 [Paenibacillus glycanilyticus]|uniref:hypothetical protein n=1 Tax=Paenibacillus glycanilyticus TaxID=126569 RepID=UPI00203ED04B|nr:hypothetical protein [Paenibacillus glycanilyticus]MCM3628779.1 hypothetical protein [Paenibacillus glycanilyticus]